MFGQSPLKSVKKAASLIAIVLMVTVAVAYLPASLVKAYSGYPTFDIVSVVEDTSVTIQTKNMPPDQTFTVRMGLIGTKAIGGVVVGTTDSGEGGALKLTYNIPDSLKGKAQIAIRMDSPAGYYAYNWFDNITGSAPTAPGTTTTPTKTPTATKTPAATTPSGTAYSGIPTFSIVSVVKDTSVTIKTQNFPAGKTFTVRMGAYGTKGIGGVQVDTIDSGSGGSFEKTFKIPESLKGSYRIAIRMDGTGGYYAYNWFYNYDSAAADGGASATPVPGYTGIPTFTISAVVEDTSVTIKTKNFPAGQTFTVKMGSYGTKGIGGTIAGTKDSGAGGEFEATFSIPVDLKGLTKIAIRMDSL